MAQGTPKGQPRALNSGRRSLAQPAKAPVGQEYGQAGKQIASQKQQPLLRGGAPGPPQGGGGGIPPGMVPGLDVPSMHPDQPLTTGLPIGPGAGPEALTSLAGGDEELAILKSLYGTFPNEDIRRLIEYAEANPIAPAMPTPDQALPELPPFVRQA